MGMESWKTESGVSPSLQFNFINRCDPNPPTPPSSIDWFGIVTDDQAPPLPSFLPELIQDEAVREETPTAAERMNNLFYMEYKQQ